MEWENRQFENQNPWLCTVSINWSQRKKSFARSQHHSSQMRDYLILYCEAILENFSASILANTIGRESLARIGAAISSCRQHHKHNKKNQIAVSTCSKIFQMTQWTLKTLNKAYLVHWYLLSIATNEHLKHYQCNNNRYILNAQSDGFSTVYLTLPPANMCVANSENYL